MIEVQGVWKEFRRPHLRVTSLKEAVVAFARGQTGYTKFWALQDVSFTVNRGESVAVIGPNGSGKSTLFSLIAKVMEPTRGRITVNGRVCPLLELGTGFHPELSGRDNVYLNGSLLGLSHREIARLYDKIVEFAELPDVLDAPVKTYSTGMMMRLAFSVAVHVDPEILLVDEVLSVGDEYFQRKSHHRLWEMRQQGKTMFVITHMLGAAQAVCERAIWLDQGKILMDGDSAKVVPAYCAWATAQSERASPHAPAK